MRKGKLGVDLNRNATRAGCREIGSDQIDRVRIVIYRRGYRFLLGPAIFGFIVVPVPTLVRVMFTVMVMTLSSVTMLVAIVTANMNMSPLLACRRVRSRSMRVSKGVAHYEDWNQQNRYKSEHLQHPYGVMIPHKLLTGQILLSDSESSAGKIL